MMSFTTRSARQKFPHPSTVGVRHMKAQRKKPWDGTVNNLEEFKSSPEEIARRKEAHRSKNLEKVKGDLQDRVLARVMRERERQSPTPSEKRQLAILKEVLHDKGEFEDVLMKSDKALTMVKDLFGDDPVRYTGFPNVTVAPAQEEFAFNYYDNLPRKPELNTSQLEQLSESIMDKNALNEQRDLLSENLYSDDEEVGSLNYQPRMDLNRFRQLLAAEQEQAARTERRTPTKTDASVLANRNPAINDSLKVKRTKQVNKENIESDPSGRRSPQVKQMKDLRKVLGNLENEIAEFERQRGKEVPTPEKQHSNTFSGYTLTLVDAVTRLTHFLRESEVRLQNERTVREQLADEVSHFRQLIDALTSELISCREDFFQLHSEFDMFKTASAGQIQQLQARVFGEDFVPKPLPPSNETYTAKNPEREISPRDYPSLRPTPNLATAIPPHVHNVQPAMMLSPPRQRDSNKHSRDHPVPEEPGPQLDAQHTVNVTKPTSLVQSGSAQPMMSHGPAPARPTDIASQIAELNAEHKRAQARMTYLQDLNTAFGVSSQDRPEISKHSSAKEDSISTRKEFEKEDPEVAVGDTPRSGDTMRSVESLMSDKDDIRRQITELNRQREKAQNMMEKIARQEAQLMQPLEIIETKDGVSPAISPIPNEGSIAENQTVDSHSDSQRPMGIMIALPTVDQHDDAQPASSDLPNNDGW